MSTEQLIAALWDSNLPAHYAEEIERRLKDTDPLGEALNSGDGSYRP